MRSAALIALMVLGGCAEVSELHNPPKLTSVRADLDVPEPPKKMRAHASTWDRGNANLFADRVALKPGDILTVLISIDDNARLDNRSDRSRTVGRSLDASGAIDLRQFVGSGSGNADLGSTTRFDGNGATARSERIRLSLAAIVTERLPNGNLLVEGRQEVRVNHELRVLNLGGIVRPSDIGPQNTIAYERIAEARISYGGRGPTAEVQKPPYGQRILDHVLPF